MVSVLEKLRLFAQLDMLSECPLTSYHDLSAGEMKHEVSAGEVDHIYFLDKLILTFF